MHGLSRLDIPAHTLADVRRQVGRYFGLPEDVWTVVPGSSVAGEWSQWFLDENRGEYREREVTSEMESTVLHFWTDLPFVKDVPPKKIPKMLTLTGLNSGEVHVDYNIEEADADSKWKPPGRDRLGEIKTEADWASLIRDQPMTSNRRRQYATAHAVMLAGLEGEEFDAQRGKGAKMLWEIASQREHIRDFPVEALDAVLANARDISPSTRWYACSAAWCLTPFASFRKVMAEKGLIEMLNDNLAEVVNHLADLPEPATYAWRASLGALSVCAVDKACRACLLDVDPKMSVLLSLAEALAKDMSESGADHWAVMLSVIEVYCSILVRDPNARRVFVANGALGDISRVMALPGLKCNFAAASAFAAFACDKEVMALMREEADYIRELQNMLRDCLRLTEQQLDMLLPAAVAPALSHGFASVVSKRQTMVSGKMWGKKGRSSGGGSGGGKGFLDTHAALRDDHINSQYKNIVAGAPMSTKEKVEIARMTAEGAVLSVWGATHSLLTSPAGAKSLPPGAVENISAFAVRTMGQSDRLGKVPESLAGCLCVLSKDPVIGPTLIQGPALGSVQSLIRPSCDGVVNSAGARAAASACVAALANPDDPDAADEQRQALLDSGTYAALLESVSSPTGSEEGQLRKHLEEAASLALMYLSCEGDARPDHEVGKVLLEIAKCDNLAAGQYMAAGVWGLLRNPANRLAFLAPVRGVIAAAERVANVEAREAHIADSNEEAENAATEAADAERAVVDAEDHLEKATKKRDDHAIGGMFSYAASDQDRAKYEEACKVAAENLEDAKAHAAESAERAANLAIYAKEVAETPGWWEKEEAAYAKEVELWEKECAAMTSAASEEKGEGEGIKGGSKLPPKPLSKREKENLGKGPDKTGLELLGETGLKWMREFLSCNKLVPEEPSEGSGEAVGNEEDPPAQVAMEWLISAIWLGMTTGDPAKPPAEAIWALSAPPGGANTWWKMSLLERPLFERVEPAEGAISRAMPSCPAYLRLLMSLAETPQWGRCTAARKHAFGAAWCLAEEDPNAQQTLIDMGFSRVAADVAGASSAPPRAREMAAGLMLQLATQAEQGLADAGGWERVEEVLISLVASGDAALALQGCKGMAWELYHREGTAGVTAARSLAKKGAISALLNVLFKAHGEFRNKAPTQNTLDLHIASLQALLNLSVVSENQETIAKGHPGPGLLLLLRVNLSFTELKEELTEHAPKVVRLSAHLLQNLKCNAANRTVFYKAELRGTANLEQELEAEAPGVSTLTTTSTNASLGASTMTSTAGSTFSTAGLGSADPSRRHVKASVSRPLNSFRRRPKTSAAVSSHGGSFGSPLGKPSGPSPGKVRGAKQAEAAGREVIRMVSEMAERTPKTASEAAQRRRDALEAAKVGGLSTEEFEASSGGSHIRGLPRLTKGLCRPLRDMWKQDASLGIANPWSPRLEYVHPQKMKEMPELAERLLGIEPPPEAGELRQELEKQLRQTLRLPAIDDAVKTPVKNAGVDKASGAEEGSAVVEGVEAETVDDGSKDETQGSSTPGEPLPVLNQSPSVVADMLTIKRGSRRPTSRDSTIPTIALPSMAPFLDGMHGKSPSATALTTSATGQSFIISGKESKARGGYPKFGSGVVKERGVAALYKKQEASASSQKKGRRKGRSGGGASTADAHGKDAGDPSEDKESVPAKPDPGFGLKIAVAPDDPESSSAAFKGSVLTFDNAVKSLDGKVASGDAPKLYMFEALEGSKVYDGVLKAFVLPNGSKAHFYFSGKDVSDAVDVDLSTPPLRPKDDGDVREDLPVANVMRELSLPKLDGVASYRPRPALPELPEYTELDPEIASGDDGNSDAHLQLLVTRERITRMETYMEREVPPPPKPPWKIHQSVFAQRAKDSDARAFFETEGIQRKACTRDWERMTGKDKFSSAMAREAKASGSSMPPDDQVAELAEALVGFYGSASSIFTYYAALSVTGVFHMHLNQYSQCLDDAKIPDADSKGCRKSDCDTMFILCNYVEDKNDKLLKEVNNDNALMRYEFLEVLVRIAVAKYGKGFAPEGEPLTLAGSLKHLFKTNILPNMAPEALMDPNDFRRDRLYFEVRPIQFGLCRAHVFAFLQSGEKGGHRSLARVKDIRSRGDTAPR